MKRSLRETKCRSRKRRSLKLHGTVRTGPKRGEGEVSSGFEGSNKSQEAIQERRRECVKARSEFVHGEERGEIINLLFGERIQGFWNQKQKGLFSASWKTLRFTFNVIRRVLPRNQTGEVDPGSERTLAACLTHASRARKLTSVSE